jgi:hypothetical protein
MRRPANRGQLPQVPAAHQAYSDQIYLLFLQGPPLSSLAHLLMNGGAPTDSTSQACFW